MVGPGSPLGLFYAMGLLTYPQHGRQKDCRKSSVEKQPAAQLENHGG